MKKYWMAAAGMVLSACLAGNSYADRRSYVWTYEYATIPAGVSEMEYYLTAKIPDSSVKDTSSWQHQAELEYGLTDNWDISLYQMWKQSYGTNSTSAFKYEGFKIRTRYKLFKSGKFFVDPLIYVEYIRKASLSEPDVLEAKLILAKDIGKFNIAYNAIAARELGGEGEIEHEYASGVKYAVTDAFSAGLEAKGNYTESEHALGPVVSIETDKFWISIGTVFGLNEATEDVQARMIAGFAF